MHRTLVIVIFGLLRLVLLLSHMAWATQSIPTRGGTHISYWFIWVISMMNYFQPIQDRHSVAIAVGFSASIGTGVFVIQKQLERRSRRLQL